MLDTITAYIEQHQLFPPNGEIIVAVSGGADSLCLLHLLHHLCGPGKRYPELQLHVAHLNHQLRGNTSTEDAAAVAQFAAIWGLPITLGEVDVPALARKEGRSLEDAARTARYRFLREVAHGQPIAVAHHADDQVETLLLHWLRGSGLTGMIGMQPRQHDIIRPLLAVTHAQTVAYCQQHQLIPLEDASNTDPRFLRNRIRYELLPLLEALNPGIRATLLRTAQVMRSDAEWIEAQVDAHWPTVITVEQDTSITLNLSALLVLPLSLQRHLLRRVTARLTSGQSPLELRHHLLIEEFLHTHTTRPAADDRKGTPLLERNEPIPPKGWRAEDLTIDFPQQLRLTHAGDTIIVSKSGGEGRRMGQGAQQEPAPAATARHTASTGAKDGKTASLKAPTYDGRVPHIPTYGTSTDGALLPIPGRIAVPGTPWVATAEMLPYELLQVVKSALHDEDWPQVWQLLPSTPYIVYIDADIVGSFLHVRTRLPGDRIQPLGMAHEKKVQDILVDKRIARADRRHIPLFLSTSHSVWLAGIQLDNRVRLTKATQRILRLSITRE